MMRMVFAINRDSFDGERQVTCYSCHRGSARPVGTPMIREDEPRAAPDEASSPSDAGVGLPGVEQLFEKYVAALGGGEALRRISTRVERGTVISAGRQFRFEAFAKAPDKRVSIMELPNGESVTAYDGKTGWHAVPGGPLLEMRGSELDAARFDADFFPAAHLKQMFNDLRVERMAEVGRRKAYPVAGLQAGQPNVRVYFDAESGLLLRLVRYEESPLGRNPTQIEFADYRAVDGVKLPFRRTVTRPRAGFTIQIEEIQHNVPMEDARFARPDLKQAEPR
jgi:hypothetical protein